MDKQRLVIATLAILFFTSVGVCEERFDFRKTRWGMTRDQVARSESAKLFGGTKNNYFYISTLANMDCTISYTFANDKLVSATYGFDHKHTNPLDFFDDFDLISTLLTEKYGKPFKANTVWKNLLFKHDPQYWGTALQLGHIIKGAVWATDSSIISLILSGENYEVEFGVKYNSKALKHLEDRERNKKVKDDL